MKICVDIAIIFVVTVTRGVCKYKYCPSFDKRSQGRTLVTKWVVQLKKYCNQKRTLANSLDQGEHKTP